MQQTPNPGSYLLRWKGDALEVILHLDKPRAGRAVLRTNLGAASVRRREIIAQTEQGRTPLAKAWNDIPMQELKPGQWSCRVTLNEVGIFSAKACFFPGSSRQPIWPEGANFHVKVEPAETRKGNSIYTVFPRQFGGAKRCNPENENGVREAQEFLDSKGYNVIPPSGTFRDVVRELPHIMDGLGFRILQLLPVFPVPTTFARMGRYGCPFAAQDFLSVDPSLAEFDQYATPLDQFIELCDAVHAKGGSVYLDLPANHTGWAATLQTHHPDWYHRADDGKFISPGAWGVVWADLVELDYNNAQLRAYMADVFLFWCRHGVDGFRCDAGYMIPATTWEYIVARVREEYPDTVFMLEGLGGKLSVTDELLSVSGLDWAYSEIFQTYDRAAFEWYLPGAIARADKFGALVHFAETHDNDRLAKGGKQYARLRVALAALLSHQGAWGIANGVEWFADEKIDVHGASSLNWGATENMCELIAKLNSLLVSHQSFAGNASVELIQCGDGNFLAARRTGGVLILVNLDCVNGVNVHWDTSKFPECEAFDLLAEQRITLKNGMWLGPGEFIAAGVVCAEGNHPIAEKVERKGAAVFNWPQDVRRQVPLPDGMKLVVASPYPFRAEIKNGERTLSVARSQANEVLLELPPYSGDGTRCNHHRLALTVFTPDGVKRDNATICVAPSGEKASAKLVYSGNVVRDNPTLETVLANEAGAAARIKLAWGEVLSQYDALLAANTNPAVPADRLVLWTRCRAWLNHEGFVREINRECLEYFRADPEGRFAEWTFRVPCGMGQETRFRFSFSLAGDSNAARLVVTRLEGGIQPLAESYSAHNSIGHKAHSGPISSEPSKVSIIFRPDLEWRSFHSCTKAYTGLEQSFPAGIHPRKDGFEFSPFGGDKLDFAVKNGEYHDGVEWSYCVLHPEEAERGQEASGDLFSPGWINADLKLGESVTLTAKYGTASAKFVEVPEYNGQANIPLDEALTRALNLFMVRRDELKTVIAGYPWFLDWGRDTLIFLRGAIAAGRTDDALKIITAFARFEEQGTIPNIIYGTTAGNRDTVDAPLWLIIAAADLVKCLGREILKTDCGGRTLGDVLLSIVENYIKGTPNGIHMDRASALIWSPSHFTWMDTNYPACTPRHGYPVDIQAMWIAALRFVGTLDKKYIALSDTAEEALVKYFKNPKGGFYDCLGAVNGEAAAAAHPEDGVRPNQLFVLSLDVLTKDKGGKIARSVLVACEQLLVPGGIRSLDALAPQYKGLYTGDEDTSRKPAYHNGTVWAWPFAMYAEAAVKIGLMDVPSALSLIASVVDNLNSGCVAHISEIADGDAPHNQKGCRAQAWSISETLRVWKNLIKN